MNAVLVALIYGAVAIGAVIYGLKGFVSWPWATLVALAFGFGTVRQVMIARHGYPEEED